ncbi:LysR family transcriptional regulator [Ketobacter sp.]
MDKIRAMQYFCFISETGSFSAAARKAQVPVSSLSRSIQALESELGAELLKRSTRHVAMTEIGKIYLDQCKEILAAIELADGQVGSYQSSPSGILRISALPHYTEFRLLPVLEALQARYPDIVLDLELSGQVSDLNRDGVDIAIRGGSAPDGRVIALKLEDNTHRLCATKAYLEQYGTPTNAEDLQQHKALFYRAPAQVLHWHLQCGDEWLPVDINPALISNSVRVLQRALLADKGLAMLPAWCIEQELADGELEWVPIKETLSIVPAYPAAGIYMLYQRPQYVIPKIKVAVDFLRSQLTCDDF